MNELVVKSEAFDQEELQGVNLILPLLKMPSGGGTFFTKKVGDEKKPIEAVRGVIIDHFPTRIRFEPSEAGKISKKPPLCVSKGGIEGKGEPGIECAKCEYSKFQKGVKTQCSMRRELYIMEEGEDLPTLLNLPGGSLKSFDSFMSYLVIRRLGSTKNVHVKITLIEKEAQGGEPYSIANIQLDTDKGDEGLCTPEERERYHSLAATFRGQIRKEAIIPEFDEESFVEGILDEPQVQSKMLTKAYILLQDVGLAKNTNPNGRKIFCEIVTKKQPHDWSDKEAKLFLDYLEGLEFKEDDADSVDRVKRSIKLLISDNK
jgi:hypothetical protein